MSFEPALEIEANLRSRPDAPELCVVLPDLNEGLVRGRSPGSYRLVATNDHVRLVMMSTPVRRWLLSAFFDQAKVVKNLLWMLAAVCLLIVAQAEGRVGEAPPRDGHASVGLVKPDEMTVSDAYIYLLGRLLMLDQERADIEGGVHSYNRISYEPLKSASGGAGTIALHTAWIAVDDRIPVILEVPEIDSRLYSVLIVDEWGDEIANINPQTFPLKPFGRYALIKAGSNDPVPADAIRIMLHSGKARMFGAIEIAGEAAETDRLRRLFRIETMLKPAIVQKRAPRPPKVKALSKEALFGVEIFDDVEVVVGGALDVTPNAAAMQERARFVALYVASRPEARREMAEVVERTVSKFQAYAKDLSRKRDSIWFEPDGNWGSNYWRRAAWNYIRGIGRGR